VTLSLPLPPPQIALDWRRNLTERFNEILFENRVLYNIICIEKKIDNTDQRVAQAIDDFTSLFAGISIGSFSGTTGGAVYLILQFLGTLTTLFQYGTWPPVLTVIALIVMTVLTLFVANRLSRLTFAQDKYEGDLRFAHARARTFSESIAFHSGEAAELANGRAKFLPVYYNMRRVFKWQLWNDYLVELSKQLPNVLAYFSAILAVSVSGITFTGVADVGTFVYSSVPPQRRQCKRRGLGPRRTID
jgi:vitamin B12/bleomycin/antimicrobial peptide transport system ATP-binding/permease protein